jgi:hypothetical protein
MWGLLNGNIGVAKTYLAEISDDSNAAKGMALFGVIGGFGRSIGPIIGGFLSSPAQAYPKVFRGTIFEKFPFALPCLVISFNCFCVLAISYFSLSETLSILPRLDKPISDNPQYELLTSHGEDEEYEHDPIKTVEIRPMTVLDARNDHNYAKRKVCFAGIVTIKVIGSQSYAYGPLKGIDSSDHPVIVEESNDLEIGSDEIDPTSKLLQPEQNSTSILRKLRYTNGSEKDSFSQKNNTFCSTIIYLLSQSDILISTLLYGTNALTTIVFNEIFPLWVITLKSQGGFEFTSHEIGIATMISGILGIMLQVTLYPNMTDRFGVLKVHKGGIVVFTFAVALIPWTSLLNDSNSVVIRWIAIVGSLLLINVASTWVLVSVFVFINNSCYSTQRATVNGIGQTFASLGRLLGPYFGASIFAWSENNGLKWPLNFHFCFYLLAVINIINYGISLQLPRSIQRRKREPGMSQPRRKSRKTRPEDLEDECSETTVSQKTEN